MLVMLVIKVMLVIWSRLTLFQFPRVGTALGNAGNAGNAGNIGNMIWAHFFKNF